MATITKVTYRRTYNLGSFQSEAIGVEMDLNPNEDPINAFKEMNKITDAYHLETLTQLDLYRGTQTVTVETTINTTIQAMIDDINNCKVVDEKNGLGVQVGLLAYEPLTTQFPEIKEAYDTKLNELQP